MNYIAKMYNVGCGSVEPSGCHIGINGPEGPCASYIYKYIYIYRYIHIYIYICIFISPCMWQPGSGALFRTSPGISGTAARFGGIDFHHFRELFLIDFWWVWLPIRSHFDDALGFLYNFPDHSVFINGLLAKRLNRSLLAFILILWVLDTFNYTW